MSNTINLQPIRTQLQSIVFKEGIALAPNTYSKKVFEQLTYCHTAKTGVHHNRCNDATCRYEQYQYHSCGNRHCPNCGGTKREQWLEDKTSELLPTSYYHVVFTLPHELNSVIMGNRKILFKLLFDASSYTLLTLAKDEKWLGATPGIISILHTWGQQLSFHPHVHCIVSGGGILNGNLWKQEKRLNKQYLFPQKIMQSIYKAYFLKQFRILVANKTISLKNQQDIAKTIHQIGFKKWNVYAKPPFGGALQVLQYLGRYTHKVAITAHRILSIDTVNRTISFKYKDYRLRKSNQIHKELTLPITEFNRRFEQHILPKGFVKIRHYGYLKNYQRKQRLLEIFSQMKLPPPPPKIKIPIRVRILEKTGADITKCPKCKHGVLETVVTYRNGYLCAAYQSTNKYEPTLVMNNKASP
jgi:hypothetical protein